MNTKSVKVHGLLHAIGGVQVGTNSDKLPVDPRLGTMVTHGNNTLIWTELNGVKLWYPLIKGDDAITYTHKQVTAATEWVIAHGLGSQDLVYSVRDGDGDIIGSVFGLTPDATNPNNKVTLHFAESISGSVFIVGKRQYTVVSVPPEPEVPDEFVPGTLPDKLVELSASPIAYLKPSTESFVDGNGASLSGALAGFEIGTHDGRSVESFAVGVAGSRVLMPASAKNDYVPNSSFVFYGLLPSRYDMTEGVMASTVSGGTGWELGYAWCTDNTGFDPSPAPAIKFSYHIKDPVGPGNIKKSLEFKLPNEFTDGLRHLICITVSALPTSIFDIYIDGVKIGAISGVPAPAGLNNGGAISLLNTASGEDKPLLVNGLSTFAKFNAALTQAQVNALQAGVEKTPKAWLPEAPFQRWVFDQAPEQYYKPMGGDGLMITQMGNIQRVPDSAGNPMGAWRITDGVRFDLSGAPLIFPYPPSENYTLHMRIKPATVGEGQANFSMFIAGQCYADDIGTIALGINNKAGTTYAGVEHTNGNGSERLGVGIGNNMAQQSVPPTIKANEWCDLVFVRRGEVLETYCNGKLAHITVTPVASDSSGAGTAFFKPAIFSDTGVAMDSGNIPAGFTNNFVGDVQEINFWTGGALYRSGIQELIRNGYKDVWLKLSGTN